MKITKEEFLSRVVKNKVEIALTGGILIGLLLAIFITISFDIKTYSPHQTTWKGHPAIGQLHSNGDYSFYDTKGNHIATVPSSLAFHLH